MWSRHAQFLLLSPLVLSGEGPDEAVLARPVLHWRSQSAHEGCVRSPEDCGQPGREWSQNEPNVPREGRFHHLPTRQRSVRSVKEPMGRKLHVCFHRGRSQEAYLPRRVQWSSVASQVVLLQNGKTDEKWRKSINEDAKHGECWAKISQSNLWNDWDRRISTEHIHKWDADQNVTWWWLARFWYETSLSCDVVASNQTAIFEPQPS